MNRELVEAREEGPDAEGLVIQAGAGVFHVLVGSETIMCALRGKLAKSDHDSTNPVVAGDRVLVHSDGWTWIIEEVLERRNEFGRKAAGKRMGHQVIAANLDQVVMVFSAADPPFKETTLNRYLAAAEYSGLDALVCLNKVDLGDISDIEARMKAYEAIGYRVILTSAQNGMGVDRLRNALLGKVSIIVGYSGVGKSTLLNAIEPGIGLATSTVGNTTHKGRHTTTASRLYPLTGGGYVVDSAGMREFGFFSIPKEEMASCFREIKPFVGACRFRNCSHISEPGCAVRAAVDEGRVSELRYGHYKRLFMEG